MRRLSILLAASLVLAPELSSQSRGLGTLFTANLPGDATLPAGSLRAGAVINAATGRRHSRLSGAIRLPNGHYIISGARAERTSSAHKFFELAADGSYVAAYDQPNHTSIDGIGLRDLGWDGRDDSSSRIWSGTDGSGIVSFDWHNMVFDPIGSFGPFGLKVLDGYRGNAIWCCAVAEIDGQSVLITADSPNPKPLATPPFIGRPVNWHLIKFPADPPANALIAFGKFRDSTPDPTDPDGPLNDPGKFGLAYDPLHSSLWFAVDEGNANPNPNGSRLRFIETDLAGQRTGKIYQGNRGIGGIARGCEIYVDDQGELVMLYMSTVITGDSFDVLVEVHGDFSFGSSCGGSIGFQGEPFVGNSGFNITLTEAPGNSLGTVFLLRGRAAPSPGVQLPGITNCAVLVDLSNAMSLGAIPLGAGAAVLSQAIPDSRSLVGAEIAYQWLLPTDPGTLPLDLSAAGVVRLSDNQ